MIDFSTEPMPALSGPAGAPRSQGEVFIGLIEALYNEMNEPFPAGEFDPEEPIRLDLEVDDIGFLISHDPVTRNGMLVVDCTMGLLPQEPEAERQTCRDLLVLNGLLAETDAGAVLLDPDSLAILYRYAAELDDVTPASLLTSMAEAALQAKRWQNGELSPAPAGADADSTGWMRA